FAKNNTTPAKIVKVSIKQLKRLIYSYRATSRSAKYSIIWQSGMLYLVNHILRDYTDKEAHFYFLLCMRGYQNLARTIPWISGVVQGIVTIAVQLGTTLPEDALKLIEEIKSEGNHIDEYMSTCPIDLYPSTADTSTATLEHLVHDFKNMQDLGTREPEAPEGWRGDSVALFTTLLEGEDEANATKLPSHQM
ncbi:hypothetical protein DM02DRAFT_544896, partial [Periconia macrospinosa]